MGTWFNTQTGPDGYRVQFGTDEKKYFNLVQSAARHCVDKKPVLNLVPVVRCQECIHWHDWGACGHPDNGFDAPPMGPDDFCSKGEPKNELE